MAENEPQSIDRSTPDDSQQPSPVKKAKVIANKRCSEKSDICFSVKGARTRETNLADHICFWIIWPDPRTPTWSQCAMWWMLYYNMARIKVHTNSSRFSSSHEASSAQNCLANVEHNPRNYHQRHIWLWNTVLQYSTRRSEDLQPPWL